MLGWVTRRHVTFGGSVVTLGIRVTSLQVKCTFTVEWKRMFIRGSSGCPAGVPWYWWCGRGCPQNGLGPLKEKSLGCSEEPRPKLRDEASREGGSVTYSEINTLARELALSLSPKDFPPRSGAHSWSPWSSFSPGPGSRVKISQSVKNKTEHAKH